MGKKAQRAIRDISEFKGKPPDAVGIAEGAVDEITEAPKVDDSILAQYHTVDYGDEQVTEAPAPVDTDTDTDDIADLTPSSEDVREAVETVLGESESVDMGGTTLPQKLPERAGAPDAKKGKKGKEKRNTCWFVLGDSSYGIFDSIPLPTVDIPVGSPHFRNDPGLGSLLGQPASSVFLITKDSENDAYIPARLELLRHSPNLQKVEKSDEIVLVEPTPQQLYRVLECTPAEYMYHIPPTFLQKVRTYIWIAVIAILSLLLFLIFSSLTTPQT